MAKANYTSQILENGTNLHGDLLKLRTLKG